MPPLHHEPGLWQVYALATAQLIKCFDVRFIFWRIHRLNNFNMSPVKINTYICSDLLYMMRIAKQYRLADPILHKCVAGFQYLRKIALGKYDPLWHHTRLIYDWPHDLAGAAKFSFQILNIRFS